jgi:hypothetical protein
MDEVSAPRASTGAGRAAEPARARCPCCPPCYRTERHRTAQTARTAPREPPDLDRTAPESSRWTGQHGGRKTHNPSVGGSSPPRPTSERAGQHAVSWRGTSRPARGVPHQTRVLPARLHESLDKSTHPHRRLSLLGGICFSRGRQEKMDRGDPSYKGQVSYNRFLLAIYDPFVLGIMDSCGVAVCDPAGRRALSSASRTPVSRRRSRDGVLHREGRAAGRTEITLLDPNPSTRSTSAPTASAGSDLVGSPRCLRRPRISAARSQPRKSSPG